MYDLFVRTVSIELKAQSDHNSYGTLGAIAP
ncbi:hypothetical protein CPS_3494 [Colwellia psychrerythraea 34H]|uniref:Uncharacterized protein n=1 Tax=Colwellia psychrerythraea (strain 34H / ATCC BAA-681) TaxID=167879 RepID=Q47YF2_COLP3|nr:hypothetical protein CPS_3494 [Colwellia psychrerythraea 34H]